MARYFIRTLKSGQHVIHARRWPKGGELKYFTAEVTKGMSIRHQMTEVHDGVMMARAQWVPSQNTVDELETERD